MRDRRPICAVRSVALPVQHGLQPRCQGWFDRQSGGAHAAGRPALRFPSVIVCCEPDLVALSCVVPSACANDRGHLTASARRSGHGSSSVYA